jgi:hypothetical protein
MIIKLNTYVFNKCNSIIYEDFNNIFFSEKETLLINFDINNPIHLDLININRGVHAIHEFSKIIKSISVLASYTNFPYLLCRLIISLFSFLIPRIILKWIK